MWPRSNLHSRPEISGDPYKEFSNFFDNPLPEPNQPGNLSPRQTAYFAGHAIAGWILGFFLIAAMGGIIQKG
jgi:hypothetical protein